MANAMQLARAGDAVKQDLDEDGALDAVPLALATPAKRQRPRAVQRRSTEAVKQEPVKRETVKQEIEDDGAFDAVPLALATPAKRRQPAQAMPVEQGRPGKVKQELAEQKGAKAAPALAVEWVEDSDVELLASVTVKAASSAKKGAARGPRACGRKIATAPAKEGKARSRKARVQKAAVPAKSGADLRAAVLALGLKVFLEIFSGSDRLTGAMMACGIAAFGVDILQGFDMLDEGVSGTVLALIAEGVIEGLWLGTPCHGLGRARRGRSWLSRQARGIKTGWPAAIRSPNHVWGLPVDELSPKDASTLETSNRLVSVSLALFRECRDRGVPVAMENPLRSYLWLLPEVRALWEDVEEATLVTLDFCAYGTPWKKSTRMLFHGWHGVDALARRCRAKRAGKGRPTICQYSACAHQHLTGINRETKTWWTSTAEPYPPSLVERIAAIFQGMP